ncbi:uncharacterized protein LOC126838558 isoform X2 [Adelges cooleyi]|uniref:uncharacterized protein LOC126838558 isoform X2 n=1 Tax=Adelges cooleyi TaxID=133065 RepID=UPI00218006F5|nr:uncharacterized protein LOC126838558 isoform X2 [Adelges cooleyi]
MAMRNNLNNSIRASNYKQVKRPNGKYGQISLCNSTICRARFKIHKDLISHLQDIHQLVASDDIHKAQDAFGECVNKRYFAQPVSMSRLPIPSSTFSQFSQSSSDDDELLLDNFDVLDVVLGSKTSEQSLEIVIAEIVNNIINEAIKEIKAENLTESTLQDLSCSDISITDETDNKTVKLLDTHQSNSIPLLQNSIMNINNNVALQNLTSNSDTVQSQDTINCKSLNCVEEEFKLGIKSISTVLSEKNPWINGPDTSQSVVTYKQNKDELPVMALTLDQKLTDINLNLILKECIRTSCLTCVYCHNSTCIAVNAKELALHMINKHRFMTVKNESSDDVVNILKTNLNLLENVYFNSENFDSTDESCYVPFDNTFFCFNCQFTSKHMKEVNSHKRSIHSRKTYDCIMCKITFSNYGELNCHLCPGADLGVWQNLSFRCLFCGQGKIPSAFRCMVHMRKAHNACDYCLDIFPNQQTLALHVNKHKMRHMCLKCNIAYLSKKDIFEHMFWKHNRDSKECKLCLTKKWPYTYHFCVPPAIFTCDECKRTFSNALSLRVHERWHSGNIPYECNICHNKFITKKLLAKHEIIHKELISPIKRKKKKKKKRGDNYNLPPLNLSSDSETDKTPRYKSDKTAESPSPSVTNYWDYVSKQKKELVHIALLDHDYTLLSTSQADRLQSPHCQEATTTVHESEHILNNSFNNSSCRRSSCSSHCKSSSSSSSSCGSNCSCSSSCSSSCDSDAEDKKFVVESPKKHKKKKKVKKIKVLSEKKIANFNLCAVESDLESEFSNTDNEDYYDINPVPLRPDISVPVIESPQQINAEQDKRSEPFHIENESTLPVLLSNDSILKLSHSSSQYIELEPRILENGESSDLYHYEYKSTADPKKHDNLSLFNSTNVPHLSKQSVENNFTQISTELCNGKNGINDVNNKCDTSTNNQYELHNSFFSSCSSTIEQLNLSLRKKRPTKRQSKPKMIQKSKNSLQISKTNLLPYTSSPLSVNSSLYSTNAINTSNHSMSSNDTRQSKRQPKKRKFFGYDSDEDKIANGNSFLIETPHLQHTLPPKKKRKSKSEIPHEILNLSNISAVQQSRPIVDVRISKSVLPPVVNDTDSDSGNLVIELPKFAEQKAIQSTERLYCHCRCPYDEVSEMIACDNPNCRVEWFHFDCVGITIAPKGNWYCPDCR